MDAAGLAALLLVADGALHELIVLKILQRCFANQAFFFHDLIITLPMHSPGQLLLCQEQHSPERTV